MKKTIALLILFIFLLTACAQINTLQQSTDSFNPAPTQSATTQTPNPTPTLENIPEPLPTPDPIINPNGETIATRILAPSGYSRKQGNEYEEYIRNLPVLPDGSPVLLYDGGEKGNQNVHLAVIDIDVGQKDRQQCADAALRLRCEFLFKTEQFDRINYHLTNGDEFPYSKYREGYRLKVDGNKTSLNKIAEPNSSYETFRKYLDILFAYAGTISVDKESKKIAKDDMKIGDVFVKGGSPGHCIIVADMCENEQGDKLFLLMQSYMPAQQIHILKNPNSDSPWHRLSELSYPFATPEWTFENECLKRMP